MADSNDIELFTTDILTAVVNNAAPEQKNTEVKRIAMQALHSALKYSRQAFECENERNFTMRAVLEATLCSGSSEQLCQVAFKCLVKICSLHYDKLASYMQCIFNVTMSAIAGNSEPVTLQAIEVWCTIAETESVLDEEAEAQANVGAQPEVTSKHYVLGALKVLVPSLWATLIKQKEITTEDSWNLSSAGSTCLSLVSACVRDAILPFIMPEIGKAITSAG